MVLAPVKLSKTFFGRVVLAANHVVLHYHQGYRRRLQCGVVRSEAGAMHTTKGQGSAVQRGERELENHGRLAFSPFLLITRQFGELRTHFGLSCSYSKDSSRSRSHLTFKHFFFAIDPFRTKLSLLILNHCSDSLDLLF